MHTVNTKRPAKHFAVPKREDNLERIDRSMELNGIFHTLNVQIPGANLILVSGNQMDHAALKMMWLEGNDVNPDLFPTFYIDEKQILRLEFKGGIGKTLKLFSSQKNRFVIELIIPAKTNVNLKMLGGTVYVDKIEGELNAKISAGGEVRGVCYLPKADISLGAGNVVLYGLRSNEFRARTFAGNIKVFFQELTPQSIISLKNVFGDVDASFPYGIIDEKPGFFKLEANGQVNNKLNANIHAQTRLGDVIIVTQDQSSPMMA